MHIVLVVLKKICIFFSSQLAHSVVSTPPHTVMNVLYRMLFDEYPLVFPFALPLHKSGFTLKMKSISFAVPMVGLLEL